MKVPFNENGEIKYKEPLFGRCVKIEIATSRDGNNTALVIEHNPNFTNESTINKAKSELKGDQALALKVVKPGMLCAKIEGTVIELPKANNKNHTPGFTADIKIYNDFGGVITEVLDRRNKYITDFADMGATHSAKRSALRSYLQNKFWLIVWVGYWDETNKKAKYTKIFTGCINTWFSYRKGVELITEMQCANVYPEKVNNEQLDLMFGGGQDAARILSDETVKTEDPFTNTKGDGWYGLASYAIQQLSTERAKKVESSNSSLIPNVRSTPNMSPVPTMSPVPILVSEEDRKKTGWFEIKSDYDYIERMKYRGDDDPKIANFYSPKRDFESVWDDILAVFPGNQKITCKIEDDFVRGVRVYKLIPLGTGERKQGKKLTGDVHYIYDYQNLLDAPMMSPVSGLQINMLLRPEIRGWDWIELQLTENNKNGKSIGVSGDGSFEMPLIMGDKGQIIAGTSRADGVPQKYRNGSVFNKPFLIYKVVHTFATHKNTWKTSVTTVPLVFGTGGV